MNAEPDVLLYHVPPSFYSQIARLALAEKGVGWRTVIVAAGPPVFESYRPWYMKLNPGGTVPTLVHDGEVVADSFLIAEYAERVFDGPRLIPGDPRDKAEMERWIDALKGISIRELSYGSDQMKRVGAFVNGLRIKRLRSVWVKHPALAALYRAKELDIQGFAKNAVDPEKTTLVRARMSAMFDEMDKVLADRPWLAGDAYSLADVVWTVTVARLKAMKLLEPLKDRPALARWYETVRRRPSFDDADVWDRMKPGKMLAMIGARFWPHLTAIVLTIAALTAALWWL